MITMKYTKAIEMILEKTGTGFSAYSPEYPFFTTATTIPELLDNAYEASCLYFEEQAIQVSHENIKFTIDFEQFFKYFRVLNAKFLAKRIGMHPTLLSQYIQGRKKPTEKQTQKILLGIHQIGRELASIELSKNE